MRKLGLLAAAAGLALCGSMAQADFTISSVRTPDAFSVGTQEYDLVTFKVTNDGLNGTGTKMQSIDVGFIAPTSIGSTNYVGNGLLLGSAFGEGDVFGGDGEATNNISIIKGAGLSGNSGASVEMLNGSVDTTPYNSTIYTNQELVRGISGTIFSNTAFPPATAGYQFATIAVIAGDPVEVLNPDPARLSFEPNSGIFAGQNADNSPATVRSVPADNATLAPYIDGGPVNTPEPASIGLLGLAAVGLVARRRRA